MKKVALYLSYLLIIISVLNCREAETTSFEPVDTGLKLKKTTNGNISILYKYDNNNLVSTDIITNDTEHTEMKVYYDGNNKIIKYEMTSQNSHSIGEYSLFEYDAKKKITGEKYYQVKSDGTFELKNASIYECDEEGRVIKAYDAVTNQVTCTINYDDIGNVTEIKSFKNGQIIEKGTYEYDTGLNPFKNLAPYAVLSAEVSSKNNVIKKSYVGYSSGQKDEITVLNRWEYNSKNYPISCAYDVTQIYGDRTDNYSGSTRYEYY
jgi:hypothetical protein